MNTPKSLPVKVCKIESDARNTAVWVKHIQNDFEIIWILEGTGLHTINGEQYSLSQNAVYVALPGDYHELLINPGAQGYIVRFDTSRPDQVDSDYHTINESWLYYYFSKTPVLRLDAGKHDKMKNLIMLMEQESAAYSSLHSEINSKCLQLFQLYLRQHIELLSNPSCTYKMNSLLKQYFWLVEKDFKTQKNVEYYARELNVSANYLNHMIKRASGYPASYHIRQRLFQEARKKAQYAGFSMKEIAYYLNFTDISHFSKFFKSMCGISFSEYKREELKRAV
ncbi:helix-turn-helix domain-containing protein [Paraflavitalea soli]|nr:helix-turn-helix domain-containing protein [Paraflavitalea soli]